MRFGALAAALGAVLLVGCAADEGPAASSTAGSEEEVVSSVGRLSFEHQGATITLSTVTHGYGMDFEGVVMREGFDTKSIDCLVSGTALETKLSCGAPHRTASEFIIRSNADGSATIENPWEHSPLAILGLEDTTPRPISATANEGINPLTLSARAREALGTLGTFETTAAGGGKVTVAEWLLLDPHLSLELKFEPNGGGAAEHVDCYSSKESPNVWATPGSPEAGLASSGVLAERIQTAATTYMLTSCTRTPL